MVAGLLIFYLTLALGVSFLCSILESVLLSINLSHVTILQRDGKRSGEIWSSLKSDDSVKPLTAILTLNTIAHTAGAVGVGSVVQTEYGNEYVTIASVLLTLGVLLFSEILPKTLGSAYWKSLSTPAAHVTLWLTRIMIIIVAPIEAFRKLLPKGESTTVTRDELAVLADIGEEEGAIEEDEETVITNLLRLSEIKVSEVMTPRVVVTAFPMKYTIQDVLSEVPVLRVSRIPVFGENIDDLRGLVIRSEILTHASLAEWDIRLEEIMSPIRSISTDSSVDATLDIFLESRQQLVAVTDEFGGTAGIVSMEDVIETLLGQEIVDETDVVDDMRKLARDQYSFNDEE